MSLAPLATICKRSIVSYHVIFYFPSYLSTTLFIICGPCRIYDDACYFLSIDHSNDWLYQLEIVHAIFLPFSIFLCSTMTCHISPSIFTVSGLCIWWRYPTRIFFSLRIPEFIIVSCRIDFYKILQVFECLYVSGNIYGITFIHFPSICIFFTLIIFWYYYFTAQYSYNTF